MSKVYCEKINLARLKYLIDHSSEYNLGRSYVGGEYVGGEAQLTLLTEFANKAKAIKGSDKGEAQILSSYRQNNGKGRQYVNHKLGLQGLARPIRHTICKGVLRDWDMANAHPKILEHYCITNNIPCHYLTDYINNREAFLAETVKAMSVSRDEAKQMFLKSINKETETVLADHAPLCLRNCTNQLAAEIIPRIVALNPGLVEEAKKSKKGTKKEGYNIGGSVVNRMMCDVENRCLKVMEEVAVQAGQEVAVLAYDGLMTIDSTTEDRSDMIQRMENAIRERIGVSVQIKEKIMDEGFDLSDAVLPELSWETKAREKVEMEEAKEQEKKKKEEAKSNADLEKEKEKAAQKITKEAEQERVSQEKIRQKQLKKQLKKQTAEEEAVEEEEEYEKMKEEFNQTHIKILEQALYINKSTDGELIPMTRKHLRDAYEHMTYGDRKSFIKRWLTDDSIPKKRNQTTTERSML
jgi:hypothetical protein